MTVNKYKQKTRVETYLHTFKIEKFRIDIMEGDGDIKTRNIFI
jgi:hypothetical protein